MLLLTESNAGFPFVGHGVENMHTIPFIPTNPEPSETGRFIRIGHRGFEVVSDFNV
jgi:hypothetical protein